MNLDILEIVLFVFFAALIVTVLFRQLKLSVILGYLLVGAVLGPHGMHIVPESPRIKELAEFGIVFLMFTVGLEFSLPKLYTLKFPVFVIGGSQVLISIIATTLIGRLFGMNILSALVVGSIVAMSSTAIVIKQLNDQLELHSPHGLNAVGILLFQDLAVVPLIILIANLSKVAGDGHPLVSILLWALIKGTFAILLIFILGKQLLRPLFRIISSTHAIELFTLTVLLVTLSAAWLTHALGLSFALGAFLAGIMLGETEFRHQIEVEIRPFRDILLGLFFISIGMLTDVSYWHYTWPWILLLVSALMFGKMILISAITYFSRNTASTAVRTGLILAQGSEFGFALLTLALTENILPADYGQVILASLLISLIFAPMLIRFNKQIASFLLPTIGKLDDAAVTNKIIQATIKLKHHIIICGYGRVGQHIARLLDKVNIPYIGLDLDAELVQQASLAGEHVIYGDPAHPGILKAAGLDHARVIVISFNDLRSTLKILGMVKHSYPHLPILVRCRDETELKLLKKYGATRVIAELFEESLTLSQHLLNLLNISMHKISELLQEMRSEDYDILQRVFTGSHEEIETDESATQHQQLRPIMIPEGAYAANHELRDLQLRESGIEIIAIRRGETKQLKPQGNVKLKPNDIIILYGTLPNLEAAEKTILSGRI